MANLVHNPHDKIFKDSFTDPEFTQEFLVTYLPKKILKIIQLSSLEVCPNSFISNNLKETQSDILLRTTTTQDNQCYIYMLAEHQSSAAWQMPIRMLEYQVSIINNHLKANKNQTSLPIVVPLLFYHGTQSPYPFSLDILELFDDYHLATQTFARPARLIDLTVIPDKVIKQHHHISMLEYNQKHIRDPEFTLDHTRNLVYIINKMINHASPEQLAIHGNIRNRITKHLHYTQYFANITDEEQFRQEIENIDYIKKENIMGPIPRKYIQQGKIEGKLEGKLEGKTEARIEVAKSMLQENLDIKLIIKLTGLPEELEKLTTSK